MTRKIAKHLPTLAVAVALVAALPVTAAGPRSAQGPQAGTEAETETEALRADLLAYVENLHQLPVSLLESVYGERLSLAEARRQILEMTPDELRRMEAALDQVPYWRELPSLLAASLPSEEHFGPLELASALSSRMPAAGAVGLRTEMLGMVESLESVPAGAVGSEYHARVDRLRERLEGLTPEESLVLRQAMSQRMPAWRSAVEARLAGEAPPAGLALRTRANCRDASFPDDILCEIDHIIDAIAEIPGEVEAFAEDAFATVTTFLTDLLAFFDESLIPTEAEILDGIEGALGVDLQDPQWMVDFFGSFPKLQPPCPPDGFDLPGIGEMGTVEADLTCKRSIKWVAEAIYDNAPDDIWGTPFKLPMAAVFYPIDYLCLCYEAASEIRYDDLQAAHRDLVTGNLDVTVSSRATQTSVDAAQATTLALGEDLAGVQGQVDSLNAGILDLDRDVAQVEAKLDVLDMKVDDVQDQEDEQSLFLLDFQELALRLRIEADLVRTGNDRVSSFQLPEAVGGFLEVVQQIVFDTIEQRAEAGRTVDHARSDFARGNEAYAALDFKRAYDLYRKAYREAVRGNG